MNPDTLYQAVTNSLNLAATMVLVVVAVGFALVVPAVLIFNGTRGRKIQ